MLCYHVLAAPVIIPCWNLLPFGSFQNPSRTVMLRSLLHPYMILLLGNLGKSVKDVIVPQNRKIQPIHKNTAPTTKKCLPSFRNAFLSFFKANNRETSCDLVCPLIQTVAWVHRLKRLLFILMR